MCERDIKTHAAAAVLACWPGKTALCQRNTNRSYGSPATLKQHVPAMP
jgi:hypothetical protein